MLRRKVGSQLPLWGGLIPENIENIKELDENGVIGFKAFMSPSGIVDFNHVDDSTIFKGMREIASVGSLLAVHAESTVICDQLAQEKQRQKRRLQKTSSNQDR